MKDQSPEQMRVAIALQDGWSVSETYITHTDYYKKGCGSCRVWAKDLSLGGHRFPDYLHDRNAMLQALETMTDGEWSEFSHLLANELGRINHVITEWTIKQTITCPLDKLGKCFLQVKGIT